MTETIDLTMSTLRKMYARGTKPADVVATLVKRIKQDQHRHAWIYVEDERVLKERCDELDQRLQRGDDLPLFGIPFGVKDNIDAGQMPTSAACPEFTYRAEKPSRAVELLVGKGAICIGKTNLDQFATGLSGARSPYGVCASVQNADYISGGSSSGSAVAVAAGHVAFALGTDTGGSGRIPAGFNGIVGVKPTLGKVSLRGVVPNCLTLDVVSVFANNVSDGAEVLQAMSGYDADDPYSKSPPPMPAVGTTFTFGRLSRRDLEFFGMEECRALYESACDRLAAIGWRPMEIDFAPFREAGRLMFEGPWIAERKSALRAFASAHPGALLDVTQRVLSVADRFSAVDAFDGIHALAQLKRKTEQTFAAIDVLLVPTAPRPYRVADMLANPIELNSQVGYYTHFAHMLDLCAVAVPNGMLSIGVPMGVTFLAPAWHDERVAALANQFEQSEA
ncbi:MAG: allophanate hydrolase [Bradyrhizobiaceae bacterium]|nr:MAG: allophanate hydrolase [Bradyrhizobiaceae bacterium]